MLVCLAQDRLCLCERRLKDWWELWRVQQTLRREYNIRQYPLGILDYTAYYGVPGQTLYYVVGFGAAFVHQVTGTFYAWIERTQRFSTIQG